MKAPDNNSTSAADATYHSGMTFLGVSIFFWSHLFNVAVVTFTVLATVSAMFALYFNSRVSAAKDAEVRELQDRLAWRALTQSQEEQLLAELRPFAGTRATIWTLGDPEAGPLGDRLIAILEEAGWSLTRNFAGTMMPPVYGIRCECPASNEAANAFVRALASVNLSASIVPSDGGLDITVGLKPPA